MNTDILIPLNKASRQNDLELRYCLRSIEKHLKNVRNIFIVGELPDWINKDSVVFIPVKDSPNNWNRARNIYNKIMAGINYKVLKVEMDIPYPKDNFTFPVFENAYSELSDNFLFMNDDHFLLSDYDAGEFPYYHRGMIDLDNYKNNQPQYKQMANTKKVLSWNECANDFDIHCPMLISKELFIGMSRDLKEWPEHGYGIKSLYGNSQMTVFLQAKECEDLKFKEPLMKESIYKVLEGRQWFSVGDRCLKSGDMKTVLQELFPNKSKYEL